MGKFDNGSFQGEQNKISSEERDNAWLTRWNKVLGSGQRYKFMPNATQMAMKSLGYYTQSQMRDWLDG